MTKSRTNADNANADITGVTVSNGLVGGGTSGSVDIGLPSVSGNSGKYLTTNGSSASWGTLTVPPADDDQFILASQIFG